ncbi:uncharacterized protein LOC117341126 [Pecten maximus]|uniref:uncharacterized protein LOC117341126 n=1 Tax=Pecten maximus TaxID=6579 RepID=UPI001458F2A1|nr:uncharacterized protein LOC117341126 [Pecten maximus]
MANMILSAIFIFISFAIFVNGDVDDITTSRHLRLIHVEIDMLTSLLTKKELTRRQLQLCITSLETHVNDSTRMNQNDEINIRKLRSTLQELKLLTEKEKELYQNVIDKMRALFPDRVLIRGPGNTAEMLRELENILSRFTDVFAEPEMDHVPTECGPTPCFEPVSPMPQLVNTINLCDNAQECRLASFAVTEENNILALKAYGDQVILHSGQDGAVIQRYNFEFELEGMAYKDQGTFFVDHSPRNDRLIYKYNTSSGQLTELMEISNGFSSYGMEVLDGMLFIGGKYGRGMHVYLLDQSRVVEIYTYITNYDQYHSVYLCASELGSKYGLFTGRIVRNEMVLITSAGERICSIKQRYEYQSIPCGVVSRDGTFFIPGHNSVIRYNNRCEPTGMFSVPDAGYIAGLDKQNDFLYVNKQNGQIAVYQI